MTRLGIKIRLVLCTILVCNYSLHLNGIKHLNEEIKQDLKLRVDDDSVYWEHVSFQKCKSLLEGELKLSVLVRVL